MPRARFVSLRALWSLAVLLGLLSVPGLAAGTAPAAVDAQGGREDAKTPRMELLEATRRTAKALAEATRARTEATGLANGMRTGCTELDDQLRTLRGHLRDAQGRLDRFKRSAKARGKLSGGRPATGTERPAPSASDFQALRKAFSDAATEAESFQGSFASLGESDRMLEGLADAADKAASEAHLAAQAATRAAAKLRILMRPGTPPGSGAPGAREPKGGRSSATDAREATANAKKARDEANRTRRLFTVTAAARKAKVQQVGREVERQEKLAQKGLREVDALSESR